MAKRNPFAAIAHGHDLAEAIVDAIREPLLVLDPDLRVIAESRSFYRTFAVAPRKTKGRLLFELGDGQWNIPGLTILLENIIPKRRTVEAYEVEHEFPSIGRRVMLLNARRVFDEDGSASAILLAIEDVTRRRRGRARKGRVASTKEILLQEMQHRVANSLQIIASILLLKARTVQSEETRHHLRDAHQRVMSVATVQEQLHASGLNERIEIGPYLQAVRQSCSVDGRRTPAALDQGASDLRRGGLQRSGKSRTDRDGARDQCVEAWLPERREGRDPSQIRGSKFWVAAPGFRQRIRAPRRGGRASTYGPWHEHRYDRRINSMAWSTNRVDLRAQR